jgi:ribosomal-protein-alanine N-acetyltransferase
MRCGARIPREELQPVNHINMNHSIDQPEELPTLETKRLLLRPLTLEDTDFIFQHFSDPQVTRYLYDEPPLETRDQAESIIRFFEHPAGKNRNRWGIVLKSTQRLAGTAGFHRWEKDYRRAEVGYDLAYEFWGRGLMSEALRAVIAYGFERMELNRIDALVYPGNPASLRVLLKLGFQQEGLLRDYFYQDGKFYDHAILGLLKKDWRQI